VSTTTKTRKIFNDQSAVASHLTRRRHFSWFCSCEIRISSSNL